MYMDKKAINVQLALVVNHGIRAGLISFSVSALSILPFSIHGPGWGAVKKAYHAKQLPWYAYTGFVCFLFSFLFIYFFGMHKKAQCL